jgi:hypothetical protein
MRCSAAGVALEPGFSDELLKFFGVFLVLALREKKTQVFDMFVTFTFFITMSMVCAHH